MEDLQLYQWVIMNLSLIHISFWKGWCIWTYWLSIWTWISLFYRNRWYAVSYTHLQSTKQANKVKLGYPVNKPWFEYNQKDGQYYRFQYGKKHIDDQNNKQLHCSNIIIQFVNATLYPDGKSLDMTLTGSGNGWFITNGKAEKITWKKDQKKGRTTSVSYTHLEEFFFSST